MSTDTAVDLAYLNQLLVERLKVKRRPVAITDERGHESIAIHSVGNLTMSWDHRAFDGAYAAAFLARMKEILQTRDWTAEL